MRCKLGFHKWGKWRDVVEARPVKIKGQIVGRETLQKRSCTVCGTLQYQTIRIG